MDRYILDTWKRAYQFSNTKHDSEIVSDFKTISVKYREYEDTDVEEVRLWSTLFELVEEYCIKHGRLDLIPSNPVNR